MVEVSSYERMGAGFVFVSIFNQWDDLLSFKVDLIFFTEVDVQYLVYTGPQ